MNPDLPNKNETTALWKKARASGMSRREFLILFASAGASAVLTACAPKVVPSPAPIAPTPGPAPPPAPASTTKPESTSPFGITTQAIYTGDLTRHVKALGAKWMRADMLWSVIEQTEGNYSWWPVDNLVTQAETAGVELVLLLSGYAPGAWSPAKPLYSSVGPEAKLQGYEAFWREMARRYKGKIRYWQIENEVTLKNFWSGSLEEYIMVLQTACKTIKHEDPGSYILLAGFATGARLTVEQAQLLLGQGRDYFDILDVHIYKPAETKDTTTMDTTVAFFYEQMRWAGYERPVWITETGAPNPSLYRSEKEPPPEMQASEVVKRYVAALSTGVERIFWFYLGGSIPLDELVWKYVEHPQNSMQNFRHMALVRNGERRLAFSTYQVMVANLEGYAALSRLDLGKEVCAFRFRKPAVDVFVLWANRDIAVSLPVGAGKVKATNIYGKTEEMEPTQLLVTNLPIFVEVPS